MLRVLLLAFSRPLGTTCLLFLIRGRKFVVVVVFLLVLVVVIVAVVMQIIQLFQVLIQVFK